MTVGWELIFGLNALLRSPWPNGSWWPDNAEDLMAYTTSMGYVISYELGNGELYHIESYVSNSHIGFDPDYECHQKNGIRF